MNDYCSKFDTTDKHKRYTTSSDTLNGFIQKLRQDPSNMEEAKRIQLIADMEAKKRRSN